MTTTQHNELQRLKTEFEVKASRAIGGPVRLDMRSVKGVVEVFRDSLADEIVEMVSKETGISEYMMESKLRMAEIVAARYMCFALLREYTPLSLVAIGGMFGGRDHSTVIHGLEAFEKQIQVSPAYKRQYESMKLKIKTMFNNPGHPLTGD